ncbi:MAG: hypothetical protein Udaeo2_09270 [Candidatus Udaeobacter sp.]|nr:MAG: hypothetical protein Udaeo2_09270 [Candidatus Udaeobacter sp.]
MRRGDIEVLIAQQQLNVAVVDQLHAARLAFYAASTIARWNHPQGTTTKAAGERNYSKNPLRGRVAARAHLQAQLCKHLSWTHKLKRASRLFDAQLQLALAMAVDPGKASLPEPEGELQSIPCASISIPKQQRPTAQSRS